MRAALTQEHLAPKHTIGSHTILGPKLVLRLFYANFECISSTQHTYYHQTKEQTSQRVACSVEAAKALAASDAVLAKGASLFADHHLYNQPQTPRPPS